MKNNTNDLKHQGEEKKETKERDNASSFSIRHSRYDRDSRTILIYGLKYSTLDCNASWLQTKFADTKLIDASMEIENLQHVQPRNGSDSFLKVTFKNINDVRKILKNKSSLRDQNGFENVYIQLSKSKSQRINDFSQRSYRKQFIGFSNANSYQNKKFNSRYHVNGRFNNRNGNVIYSNNHGGNYGNNNNFKYNNHYNSLNPSSNQPPPHNKSDEALFKKFLNWMSYERSHWQQ